MVENKEVEVNQDNKQQEEKENKTFKRIVIALLILILLSVAVLGYLGSGKKKLDLDEYSVNQMNIALIRNEKDGNGARNAYEAVQQAIIEGFILENLTPTLYNNNILYDAETNRFLLLDSEWKLIHYDYDKKPTNESCWFFVCDNKADIQKIKDNNREFSIYLSKAYDPAVDGANLTITSGFDAGDVMGIDTIIYKTDKQQNAVIRTNASNLKINAANSTVKHFGLGLETSVDAGEMLEFGIDARVTFNAGSIKMAKGAVVYNYINNGSSEFAADKVKGNAVVYSTSKDSNCQHHLTREDYDEVKLNGYTYFICKYCGSYTEYLDADLSDSRSQAASYKRTNVLGQQFNAVAVNTIRLNYSSYALKAGSSVTLQPIFNPQSATVQTVTWKSSDTSIATVTDGVVRALKAGTVTITVTSLDGNKSTSCVITVTK